MCHVAGQRGHVTDLRTTDDTATFHQAGAMINDGLGVYDLRVCNGATDDYAIILMSDLVQPGNT